LSNGIVNLGKKKHEEQRRRKRRRQVGRAKMRENWGTHVFFVLNPDDSLPWKLISRSQRSRPPELMTFSWVWLMSGIIEG
jgi:hypothetical protein